MLSISASSNKTVELTDLTHATIEGNGVFDVLMRAVKAHIDQEWATNRIKGTEYSTVYLSALQATLEASIQFLLAQEKTNAEIELIKGQAEAIAADISLKEQQLANLVLEAAYIPKQGLLID